MATYYVRTTGNDSYTAIQAQNPSTPWLTLSHACSTVTSSNNTIDIGSGEFYESGQIQVASGVSIVGAGIDVTIIHLTYSASYPCLKLESYGHSGDPAYGNQSISYLTLDGDLTGLAAISVNFRCNVKIHHIKVIDFYRSGVTFWGQPSQFWGGTNPYETWKSMPSAWSTGNEFYDCTVTNSGIYTTYGYGNVQYGSQDGIKIYNNTITQTGRTAGSNGYGIKYYDDGWNKNVKVYNNTITVARRESGKFNFSIENWNDIGGCEYYDNELQGQIDFSATMDLVSAGYGSWFHDNTVGFNVTPQNTEVGITPEAALVEDCIINNNIFKNLTNAIVLQHIYPIPGDHPNPGTIDNVQIYNNLLYNIGESDSESRWTYGSCSGIGIEDYPANSGNVTSNIYIYNNTIVSSGIVRSNTYMTTGINIVGLQTLSNIYIRNNIIQGFKNAVSSPAYNASILASGAMTNTNLKIEYNCFYDNGNSNAPLWISYWHGQFVPGTGYSYIETVISNPLFIGSGSYKLQETSPCIDEGVYVGLITDLDDEYWGNPPSIGAYEYISSYDLPTVSTNTISNISYTTATGGGNVTDDGGATVTSRGVCWSESINPTVYDSYTTDGSGTGAFISYLINLLSGTGYYVRAYAINSEGTAYGSNVQFDTLEEEEIDPHVLVTFSNICSYAVFDHFYEYHEEGSSVIWRLGVRNAHLVLDKTLTETGFDGIEDTDWENMWSVAS